MTTHCWEEGGPLDDCETSTCMALDGHKGPHEFVPDDQIMVRFVPTDEEAGLE
jgi:hypothetical protein